MMTSIEWVRRPRADGSLMPGYTFNGWSGCTKVSPGCAHCYAESIALHWPANLGRWGARAARRIASDDYWRQPERWNRRAAELGEQHLVFAFSMGDVFERRRDLEAPRARLFDLIWRTQHLVWLLLTKRTSMMTQLAPAAWRERWPSNVWALTTVEDQQRTFSIAQLRKVPAVVRGLSVEPMLGDLIVCEFCEAGQAPELDGQRRRIHKLRAFDAYAAGRWVVPCGYDGIDWIILGGESGGQARPFKLESARGVIAGARTAGVAVFVKQLGRVWARANRRPLRRADPDGADPAEWPEDLRIREWPVPAPTWGAISA